MSVIRSVEYGTSAVYAVVALSNAGASAPELSLSADRSRSAGIDRCTVTVYVFWVIPLPAVTTIVIVFVPTLSATGVEVAPDTTVVPFTVTVAPGAAVGCTVTVAVVFVTTAA